MSIPVLDHGYVDFIEAWGHGKGGVIDGQPTDFEAGIIEAARQSTQGSFRGWDRDEGLLRHLFSSNPQHSTPFEFAGMVIEVRAPIFVFREWHRHRTKSYNEMSARYAPLPDFNYMPTLPRLFDTDPKNKQAQGITKNTLTPEMGLGWLTALSHVYDKCEELYQVGLQHGIPKEVARVILPVGRYTQMRASANLRNWLAFLTLRMHPKAQWEIRQFANVVGTLIAAYFPRTWKMFDESRPKGE